MPGTGVIRRGDPAPVVIELGGVEVTVRRRRVRRFSMGVHPPDGRVIVTVPLRTSDRVVTRFVLDNLAWIDRHQRRIREEEERAAAQRRPDPQAVAGEVWWRFGQALRLERIEAPGRPTVRLRPDRRLELRAPADLPASARLERIERWRRAQLRTAAERTIEHWAPVMRVEPSFLGIRRMTTRWGSCVPQEGRIWLNLELARRPPSDLEYVVVHELAHLLEGSHGRRFIAIMDRHLPDWRGRKAALDRPWPLDG